MNINKIIKENKWIVALAYALLYWAALLVISPKISNSMVKAASVIAFLVLAILWTERFIKKEESILPEKGRTIITAIGGVIITCVLMIITNNEERTIIIIGFIAIIITAIIGSKIRTNLSSS